MKKMTTRLVILIVSVILFPGFPHAESHELEINSEAAVLMDTESGAILYGKNEHEKMYPASLTKIATAIYAIEKGDLNEKVTVADQISNVEGTKVYLVPGEKVSLKKLIQGMLINSGNDAAVAIAIHLDGSIDRFSKNINRYLVKQVGVENTHFTNPNGLYDANHYTTAEDLGKILNYAMKNSTFKEIFGTKELKWGGEVWKTTLYTHHRMLKGEIPYEGVTGGKTGFVNESKQTLATTSQKRNLKLTVILLKNQYKREIYNDTIKLFDYGYANYDSSKINKGKVFFKEGKKFRANEDIYLTKPLSGGKSTVTSEGVLTMANGKGEVIQSLQLEPVVEKEMKPIKTTQKPESSSMLPLNPMVGAGMIFMVGMIIYLNKNKNDKRKNKRS